MAREPAITFRGALRILGHYDRPWLDRLDRLLGGVLLASGALPAASALWGWMDQKNEATTLLRGAVDAASRRLTRTGGLARHELVVAAHTMLVLAAFFETLRETLGQTYDAAAVSDAEKVRLGTGEWQRESESLVRHLYTADVSAPSAVRGFEENVDEIRLWAWEKMSVVVNFLVGLGFESARLDASFADSVSERYRSDYLRLATAVPEFAVWADLTEHAATRSALTRLESLLFQAVQDSAPRDLRALVRDINRAELGRPVIDVNIDGYGVSAVFPTVERIFLTPRLCGVTAGGATRLGDEDWWANVPQAQDLDTVLARHFSTPGSTRLPLLLLGHPGAGKSLLMKVLAARLPESTYTVVRVPLRQVDADANVSAQIQQALSLSTNGRVSWPDLADQSDDVIRVILLDGLDELLQATTNGRAGYLTDIVEFQRVEAAMGKPVAVVVTSRTLVADRVRVPDDTPVLKLEDFDDDQIREWLRIWHDVNGGVRRVTPELVMAQGELARQPLLLLMLTLYFADPDVSPAETHLSTVELYERLLETYARREVVKQAGRILPDAELAQAIRTQLDRLSIAALGMFNRGRQSVTEAELGADLAALGEPTPAGVRLLGEFFFVHAAEATAGDVQRRYEFLHATFAEYLVATKVAEVLADVAEGAYGRRRFHEPDDELLYALLSHQPLAAQRPVLDFLDTHLQAMEITHRTYVLHTLESLIRDYRRRRPANRYPDYRPLPPDTVRALATYSANLVAVRVRADPGGVELTSLWPNDSNAWPATVNLWAAGLDTEGYRAMLVAAARDGDRLREKPPMLTDNVRYNDFNAARLRGDAAAQRRLHYGHAVLGEVPILVTAEAREWSDIAIAGLLSMMVGESPAWLVDAPDEVSMDVTALVADVAYGVLGVYSGRWDREETERFLRWLMRLRAPGSPSPLPLVLVEHRHAGLLEELRSRPDEDWTTEWRTLLRAATPDAVRQVDVTATAEYLSRVVPRAWKVPSFRED